MPHSRLLRCFCAAARDDMGMLARGSTLASCLPKPSSISAVGHEAAWRFAAPHRSAAHLLSKAIVRRCTEPTAREEDIFPHYANCATLAELLNYRNLAFMPNHRMRGRAMFQDRQG